MAQTPLQNLIRERCHELNLTPVALVRRLGYSNTAKGLRRLGELYNGELHSDFIVQRLPGALALPRPTIDEAISYTQRAKLQAKEESYRRNFQPHAIIMTERITPNPLHVALLIGIERLLRIDLDEKRGRSSFVQQALERLDERVKRWHGSFPGFGRPVGFTINYAQERAVRFDLSGRAIEFVSPAIRLPDASLTFRNKTLSRSSNVWN